VGGPVEELPWQGVDLADLDAPEVRVEAVDVQQVLVGAAFDDHLVVEDDDLGVAQDGPDDGEALALSTLFSRRTHFVPSSRLRSVERNPFANTSPTTAMTLADREWRLVREEAREGPLNMALDEVAAETAAAEGTCTARIYRWKPSTLSLGYHQDPATIDWDFCEREGITVTRRPTGGGAIYHDSWGDISYSVVAPAEDLPGDLIDSYEILCEPLFDALASLGIDADFADEERPAIYEPACYLRAVHPAHDVVAGGRKLSGNAQYRQRDAVVQHGSLTFERTTDRHLACFADPDATPADFDERVTSVREQVDVTRAETVDALEAALTDWSGAYEGNWREAELDRARARVDEKFATDVWTHDGTDPVA